MSMHTGKTNPINPCSDKEKLPERMIFNFQFSRNDYVVNLCMEIMLVFYAVSGDDVNFEHRKLKH